MAIPQLTDEQVQTWSVEQKDRWWLTNVFRGDMAQLTVRSAITGFFLGGILSATNLYIGAKTGWTLGVGLTSVILAFAIFKIFSALRLAKDFTILENNAMQSIATSAGYMTGPLISGLAAYMMVQNQLLPWWQMLLFNMVLAILGVLVAFPMKRRFINDEQQPFPEGRAAGVVLDTLYTSDPSVGIFQAKVLAVAALFSAFVKFITAESFQTFIQIKAFGLSKAVWLSEYFDHWYYWMVAKIQGKSIDDVEHVRIMGIKADNLGLQPGMELAMVGAGGLMGVKSAINMMVGMVATWGIVVPLIIKLGDITPKVAEKVVDGKTVEAVYNQRDILVKWPLWPGVAIVVVSSLVAFFAKPQVIISAFKGLFAKKAAGDDCLKDIEFPLWISFVGIPVVGAICVWMAHAWFDVPVLLGVLAIPLTIALTLIAINATALTSITPTGSLSKITQLTFGVLNPKHPGTNLMTATMTTDVASNAANLLMDIKPGYMLGAKPRQQAVGHCIGIFAGALASTPLFFLMFLAGHPQNPFTKPNPELADRSVQDTLVSGDFSFVGAVQWKGISDLINKGWGGLPASAQIAMVVGVLIAVVFEVARIVTKGKSPISPVALGLGILLPPDSTMAMFFGSMFFWSMGKIFAARKESFGHRFWIDTKEPICAGLIAGWSLMGIADALVKGFLL
ncbi:MAG: OPT family oligopeptide transporter [Phycisphaerales bacterium]